MRTWHHLNIKHWDLMWLNDQQWDLTWVNRLAPNTPDMGPTYSLEESCKRWFTMGTWLQKHWGCSHQTWDWLVVSTPSEKYERQLGLLFSIYGKIKKMLNWTIGFHLISSSTTGTQNHQSWGIWPMSGFFMDQWAKWGAAGIGDGTREPCKP